MANALACAASRLVFTRTAGVVSIGVIALHVDQSVRDAQQGALLINDMRAWFTFAGLAFEECRGQATDANGLSRRFIDPGEGYCIPQGSIDTFGTSLGAIVSAACLKSALLSSGDIDVTVLTQSLRAYRVGSIGAIRAALEPL